MRDDLVSAVNIDVDTYEGKVILIGNVKSEQAKNRAIGMRKRQKALKALIRII